MARPKRNPLKGSDAASSRRTRKPSQPGAKGEGLKAKAINRRGEVNRAKLVRNQRERLGVGADHKTGTMRAKRRGTFP